MVYRLIMASSVEEKMYEKQVFKDGVRVVTESGASSTRYFSQDETSELFTLGPAGQSLVMEKLWKVSNSPMRDVSDTCGPLKGVLGYSRHDTLYSEIRPNIDCVEDAAVDPTMTTVGTYAECDESCSEDISKQTCKKVISSCMRSCVITHPP